MKAFLHLLAVVIWLAGIHFIFTTWLALLKTKSRNDGQAVILFFLWLGMVGYLVFWLSFLQPVAGTVASALVLATPLPISFVLMKDEAGKAALKGASALVLPVSAYVLLLVVIGYYPGFFTNPSVASHRWMELANDNIIPKVFGDQLRSGLLSTPMIGDWLSSDRPPLQTGLYLMFLISSKAFYQVLSMALQSLILLPVSMLVRHLGQRRLEPYVLIVFGLSSLMVMNVFHVWPKLLAASYLLIVVLMSLGSFGDEATPEFWAISVGGSTALAMLAHGGSAFTLLAVALLLSFRYGSGLFRRALPALLMFIVLYAPWFYYQKALDPPGDRLVKWHLAGLIPPHPELSLPQVLQQAWSGLDIHVWLQGRLDNIRVIVSGSFDFFVQAFRLATALFDSGAYREIQASMIDASFHQTAFSFWFLSVWLLVLIVPHWKGLEQRESRELMSLVGLSVLNYLIWVVLMFIPESTVIHHGSYLPWVVLFVVVSVTVWIFSEKLFFVLAVLNGLMFFLLYVMPGPYGEERFQVGSSLYFVLVFASVLLFVRSCFSRHRNPIAKINQFK